MTWRAGHVLGASFIKTSMGNGAIFVLVARPRKEYILVLQQRPMH